MGKKKNKLPSGNFRVQVLDYVDPDGKRHYQSFTAASKQEAKMMAQEWKNSKRSLKDNITVYEAVEKYIDVRSPDLRSNTINGYNTILKRIKKYDIAIIRLRVLSNVDLQSFISDMCVNKLSPKTIKNTFAVVVSALELLMPDFRISVTLPKKKDPKLHLPTTVEIQKLLDACPSTEMKIAVLFACEGTMRNAEACAIEFSDCDFENKTISITKELVYVDLSHWELEPPKTEDSVRTVQMPDLVFKMIQSLDRKTGFVVNITPKTLDKYFKKALISAGLPEFRYHDLRHYAASEMHANSVPERYIEKRGGWAPGSNVLKRTYENVIDLEKKRQEERIVQLHKFSV